MIRYSNLDITCVDSSSINSYLAGNDRREQRELRVSCRDVQVCQTTFQPTQASFVDGTIELNL